MNKNDPNVHKVDWNSFMNDDNDPYLNYLANKLLQDPELKRILKDGGYDEEAEN